MHAQIYEGGFNTLCLSRRTGMLAESISSELKHDSTYCEPWDS